MERVRRQHAEAATRHHRLQHVAHLFAEGGERLDLRVRVDTQLLPMEKRSAHRRGDCRQHVAGVGQHRDRFAQLLRVDVQRDALDGRVTELLREATNVGEGLGQLIDGVQVVGDRHARIAREQVAGQVCGQALDNAG